MSNGQKNTATGTAQNAAITGYGNSHSSYNTANAGYQNELANPGYTAAEKQAITQATSGSLAGAANAQANALRDQAARTGNAAGVNATAERIAQTEGQQNAQALGGLQEQFGNAAIQGTQNALAGESGLSSSQGNVANSAQGTALKGATTPGFWTQVAQNGVSGLARGAGALGGQACWIADAIYGAGSAEARMIRWYLNAVWERQSRAHRAWMAAYRVFGRPLAWGVRHWRWLRALLVPYFAHALDLAAAEMQRREKIAERLRRRLECDARMQRRRRARKARGEA